MWILLAFLAAFLGAVSTITSKLWVEDIETNVGTAIRVFAMLIFMLIVVLITGTYSQIPHLTAQNWLFLSISGVFSGFCWIFFYQAIRLGDVNKVTAIDKSSTVLTMFLGLFLLKEPISLLMIVSMGLISIGIIFMVKARPHGLSIHQTSNAWLWYSAGSAVTVSLSMICGKIGLQGIDSNLGSLIRLIIIFAVSFGFVLIRKKLPKIKNIKPRGWFSLCMTSVIIGFMWMALYRALQIGYASVVTPISQLSIVLTVVFAATFLKEKVAPAGWVGLGVLTSGILLLLIP